MEDNVANIDSQKLRRQLLTLYNKYHEPPMKVQYIEQSISAADCSAAIDQITDHLLQSTKKKLRQEVAQAFKQSEDPEIPYFAVIMDIMQFMNEFVGDPHTVELIFVRVNNEVARRKLELDKKTYYSDKQWTSEVSEGAIQQLRDAGTERDYILLVDKLLETLSTSVNDQEIGIARIRLLNIVRKHTQHELKDV
jgi:metal-sulfur cluster biosynthetic enzyme